VAEAAALNSQLGTPVSSGALTLGKLFPCSEPQLCQLENQWDLLQGSAGLPSSPMGLSWVKLPSGGRFAFQICILCARGLRSDVSLGAPTASLEWEPAEVAFLSSVNSKAEVTGSQSVCW
jgi:hypothetical protein